ncbi:response regulator transcription factor [Olivibacter domesticus]|uniref:Two component transcriptional regulator, LuxR family n=1 Tax=Olivibacter domesticus TaxID=407022 RepID=A0A1H7U9Z0_OLID1|nr:response regulator transcription factor [Olivibacter domesticus]SEL93900.1 two component transcriptional regulator, LuxR family [Olivibacter domesticus]
MNATIGIVEDQQLILKSLEMLVNSFSHFDVVLSATNGLDLFEKLDQHFSIPDILLIDVRMPLMDGVEVAVKLKKNYPAIKVVALSGLDDSMSVVKMIKSGCCAYLLKSMNLDDLEFALEEIWAKGYYNSRITDMGYQETNLKLMDLKENEMEFLKLACTDLTYHEIASIMCLSIKTIDGYRATLFDKFQVRNRIGLILEVLRHNLIAFPQAKDSI